MAAGGAPVVISSPRRGRVFLAATIVCAVLSAVAAVTAGPAERDVRLLLLPVVTCLWAGQWLLARHNGVVLGDDWVEVRNNGLRAQRVPWADVITAEPEPWIRGYRLRLWTLDAELTTPSLTPADLARVLARAGPGAGGPADSLHG